MTLGRGGGTGAAPLIFRDNISVPTIPALARARRHLDRIGRGDVTLIITGNPATDIIGDFRSDLLGLHEHRLRHQHPVRRAGHGGRHDPDGHPGFHPFRGRGDDAARGCTSRGQRIPQLVSPPGRMQGVSPKGKPFRLWRPALDPAINPDREDWPGIQHPDDIWNEIVVAAEIPGVTSAPKLQPIAARIVMLQSGMRAPMGIKVKGPDLETIEAVGLQLEQLLKEAYGSWEKLETIREEYENK